MLWKYCNVVIAIIGKKVMSTFQGTWNILISIPTFYQLKNYRQVKKITFIKK